MSWTERAADRSPMMQRWRSRNIQQMSVIVDAAKRLLDEKGAGFTTQELAREAGIALQTFYRHFGGKDQLLLAVLEDIIAESVVAYEERARHLSNPLDRLRSYINEILGALDADPPKAVGGPRFFVAEHWRLHQLHPEEVAHADQAVTDLFARELRAALDAGLLAPVDVDRSAELLTRLLMSVFHHYAFAPRRETAEQIAGHVWEFCLVGIGGGGMEQQAGQPD